MNIKVQCDNVKGSREKNIKPKITRNMLSKRKTEKLSVKTSPLLFKPKRSTSKYVGVKGYQRDPQNLIYSNFLSSPSSNYQWTSRNLIFTSFLDPTILPGCICQVLTASFGKSPKLPKLQNTLYTLNRCELCLDTILLSRYNNGRGKEKRLQWFLTNGWGTLSLKWWVYCVVL